MSNAYADEFAMRFLHVVTKKGSREARGYGGRPSAFGYPASCVPVSSPNASSNPSRMRPAPWSVPRLDTFRPRGRDNVASSTHLPDKFFLGGTQTVSLRDVICRELIANTLIHREYTSPFPAKLVIDSEGIRTENANRPRFIGRLTPERFNPLPKNPIIAEFFTNIGRADTLGSGTRNLFKYAWAYGGSQPELDEGDVFEAVVPLLRGSASAARAPFDVDEVIFRMMRDYGFATIQDVAAIAGVTERTVRRHLAPLVTSGEVAALGSTRNRRFILQTEATREGD